MSRSILVLAGARGRVLALWLVMAGVMRLAAAPYEAPARATVPADGKITITDHGYRDWPAALLHYGVKGNFKPGPVALRDKDGKPIPAQVDDGVLCFVAALSKEKTATFTLGAGAPAKSSLQVTANSNGVEVRNEFFAVRLPPVGKHDYKTPETAAKVPAPLTAWQPAGGPWMGASRFVTEHKVKSATMQIRKNGPACFEYEARYQFAPEGEYVCRVTVAPGIDYADVVEEYDFNKLTDGQDFLILELQRGMQPATLGWVVGTGPNDNTGSMNRKPFQDYIAAKLKANANPAPSVGGAGPTPMPPMPEAGMTFLDKFTPTGRWGPEGGVELRAASPSTNQPPAERVAVVPMHVGDWRRTLALTVWHEKNAGLVVALPISGRQLRWYADLTDDISPFSTHEHDIGLRPSYGRRNWALYFGAAPETLQATAGYIGLDEFKNWILDWPETAKPADYPRAWFTKADVVRLKQSLDHHPDKEQLSKYFVFSGKKEDAIEHAKAIGNGEFAYLGNWVVNGLSHYRQAQICMAGGELAEDALACPDLPADLRQQVRRTLAVSAYLFSNPDMNPRGAGVHLGNTSMPNNRTSALLYYAALLPDHPLYKSWMAECVDYLSYANGLYFTPDGVALEPPGYQLYGPTRFFESTATILHNTGGPDLGRYVAANVRYLGNLSMPDVRFLNRRILPGMGNSPDLLENIFGITLDTVARVAPAEASMNQRLQRINWDDKSISRNFTAGCSWFAFRYRGDIPESKEGLETCIQPGWGVTFRAHFGSPDETAMLFRAPLNHGHWDPDDGNVILYGKGAPLSPGTLYQYYGGPAGQNNAIYHNQVKVGARDQQEVFGRVDVAITDYGFGPSADYAANSRLYPSQLFPDRKGAMSWNRHVLFLKSEQPAGANYFVMRDTFPGGAGRPTMWNWLNLGSADVVRVEGKAFDKDKTPFNQIVPEGQFPLQRGRVIEFGTEFGAGTWMWFANGEPLTFRARMTFPAGNQSMNGLNPKDFPKLSDIETKTIIEAVAKPGEDYFYVVYPKKDGENPPACERVAEHALKIKTAESTDYVFVADEPMNFAKDDVVFTGKAGAVRVFPDRVVFCLNAGTGKIGYKGTVVEGPGPFERTVKIAALKPGVTPVNDTYEKKRLLVDLGGNIQVDGEGPVEAKIDGKKIVLNVDGRARVIYVTRPDWIWQPWMTVDAIPWMVCWTDYPANGWGTYDRTNLMAVSVPAGKHRIELSDRVFPPCWPRRFEPSIAGAVLHP